MQVWCPRLLHPLQVCCAACLDDEKPGILAEATIAVILPTSITKVLFMQINDTRLSELC